MNRQESCLLLRLDVTADNAGGWSVGLGDGRGANARGVIRATDVGSLRQQIADALQVRPGVLTKAQDALRTRAEERVGRALSIVLEQPGIALVLNQVLGAARATNARVVLALDATDQDVRALPWELLAARHDEPPMEGTGPTTVARLIHSPARHSGQTPWGTALRILTWCPTPDDSNCRAVLANLAELARENGSTEPVRLDPFRATLPQPIASCVDVLHIVCHGGLFEDEGILAVREDAHAIGTAAHVLSGGLEHLALVVLDVCDGGHPTSHQLANLAGRLVAGGALACVAPAQTASVDAVRAFAVGLHESLRAGGCIAESVSTGRQHVRALARPHADSRWCNHIAFLADLVVASCCPISPGWIPDGWPIPDPCVMPYLNQARKMAEIQDSGFIGLEHLALSFVQGAWTDPALRRLQLKLPDPKDATWRRLSVPYQPDPERRSPAAWVLTLRLREIAQHLRPGFDLRCLWECICADPHHGLHTLGQALSFDEPVIRRDRWATLPLDPPAMEAQLPDLPSSLGLQVLWGPEDGRVLIPRPGDTIGRWADDGGPSIGLFKDHAVVDPHMPRRVLLWMGQGEVELLTKGVEVRRMGQVTRLAPGRHRLLPADILALTTRTWMRVVPA